MTKLNCSDGGLGVLEQRVTRAGAEEAASLVRAEERTPRLSPSSLFAFCVSPTWLTFRPVAAGGFGGGSGGGGDGVGGCCGGCGCGHLLSLPTETEGDRIY